MSGFIYFMTIECQNCGLVDDYTIQQAGPHQSAYCNGCSKYIKHIPQNKPVTIYFGKYKGRELASLKSEDELRYLTWLTNTGNIKPNLKTAIDKHLLQA